jgi:phytol kinase
MTTVLAIAGVGLVLVLLLALATQLHRVGLLGAEASRKLVHSGIGLTVAAFPALFHDRWPVWLLSGLAVAVLLAVRHLSVLRPWLAGGLHGVERSSWGDLFFPLAAALAWTLAPGDWLRFSLPMLVLALADALAALVGRSYGRLIYSSAGHPKTWEGSLAFALVTFLVVEIPLLLGTDLARASVLLIALNLAVLLMLVEALAWEGSDNLLIPLAGLMALDRWLGLPLAALQATTVALLLLAIACWAARRWTTLDDAAVLACGVIGYLTWALAGVAALLAPWTVFLLYGRLYPPQAPEHGHRALIPIAIAAPSLAWLWFARDLPDELGLMAAAGAYATQLAAIGLVHGLYLRPDRSWPRQALGCWALAQALVLMPTLLLAGAELLPAAGMAALGSLVGLLLFGLWQPRPALFPVQVARWLRQSLLAAAGSAAVLLAGF